MPAGASVVVHRATSRSTRDVGDRDAHACVAARQPLEVGADRDDVEQHPLQRRRDRHLAHRLGEHAVADHQPFGADREVAADRVHARVQPADRLHEQPVADLRRRAPPAVIAPGASDSARQPTPGVRLNPPRTADPVETVRRAVPCRCCAGTSCSAPCIDEHVAAASARPSPSWRSAPSDSGFVGSSTSVSTATRSPRPCGPANGERPLSTRSPVERAADDAEERGRDRGRARP